MADQPAQGKIEVNLKWPLEDDLRAVYANHFAISEFGPEIVLSFGEFLPTGLPNRPRDDVEEYLRNATITPVAKVIVSPAGLEAFLGLLKGYMDKKRQGE